MSDRAIIWLICLAIFLAGADGFFTGWAVAQ
jgi:hypothetical protein